MKSTDMLFRFLKIFSRKICVGLFTFFLMCLDSTSTNAQTVNLDDGLVAYYPFNGNANDESGNGNDGTVNGATLISDRSGQTQKAYNFDGNDFISVKPSDSLNIKSRTISLWFRLEENVGATQTLLGKAHGCANSEINASLTSELIPFGHFEDTYAPGSDDSDVSAKNPVSIGKWIHYLHTWDETSYEHKIWINGSFESSKVVAQKKPIWSSSSYLGIGAVLGACGRDQNFVKGQIDDVRIYNRALSETEVAELYKLEKPKPQPGNLLWTFDTGGAVRSSPAIGSDGTIYVGSLDNNLYAINPDGTKRWEFATEGPINSSPAIGADGTVYILSKDKALYAIDGKTGVLIWVQIGAGSEISSPAVDVTGTVYISSEYAGNKALAFNGKTGAQIWEFEDGYMSPPAISADGTVYIGGKNSKFYAIDGKSGIKKWEFQTDSLMESSPAIGQNGFLYITTSDYKVYALDIATGYKKWEFTTAHHIASSAAIGVDGRIYVGSYDNKVYALNGQTGEELWHYKTGDDVWGSPAIGQDGVIYIGSKDHKVYALNGQTGEKQWGFKTGGKVYSSAVVGNDGVIYIGSDDGKLYALKTSSTGPADSPWPMFGQNAQRTGRAPSTSGSGSGNETDTETTLETGLVAYYPFNGNANDESGNGNNGTVNGATLIADRNGETNKAYNFDGDDTVKISGGLDFSGDFVVSAWYRFTGELESIDHATIFGNWRYRPGMGICLRRHNSQDELHIGLHSATNEPANFSYDLTGLINDQWHNVIFKRINLQGLIYLNGDLIGTIDIPTGDYTDNEENYIGNWGSSEGNSRKFVGQIDDIRIYNRALSESEVTELYELEKPKSNEEKVTLETGLVAYYPFNGNANDESGNGHDGTVNGATLAADRNGETGKAYSFDGEDDYLEFNVTPETNGSLTAALWFKIDSHNLDVWRTILEHGRDNNDGYVIALGSNDDNMTKGGIKVEVADYKNNATDYAQYSYSDDLPEAKRWHQLVFVLEKKVGQYLYINGALSGSDLTKSASISPSNPMFLGKRRNDVWNKFIGQIDDVRIYNRALSESEVSSLYELEKPKNDGEKTDEQKPDAVSKPLIVKQDAEALGTLGETITLSLEVTGENITYQWQKDGQAIAGATGEKLELSGLSAVDAGSYVLKITNAGGSTSSEPIEVKVQTFVIRVNGEVAGSKAKASDNALIKIESGKPGDWLVYYTLDGSMPDFTGTYYSGPFELQSGTTIRAMAYAPEFSAPVEGPTVELLMVKGQTITVQTLAGLVYGGAPVALVGSSDSGLALSYKVTDGPGRVEDGKLVATGVGVVQVKASQFGNDEYAPAEKSFDVLVSKGTQAISWANMASKTYGDGPFEVNASASSGLAVSYEVVSGPATLEGNKVTLTGGGTVVLKASRAGDANWKGAEAEKSFEVGRAKQTINFGYMLGKEFTSEPIKLGAVASSGLSVSYAVMSGPATVFGDELTLTGIGTVTVRAKHLGNADYEAASAVDRTFSVSQGTQSLEIVLADQIEWQSEPVEVGLKASSELKDFKLQVLSGPVEVMDGSKLNLTGVGEVQLILSESGDDMYGAALVQKTVEVVKAKQTIEFGEIADRGFGADPIELGAVAGSGLEVSYEVVSKHKVFGEAWRIGTSEVIDGKFVLPMKGFLPQTVTVKAIQGGSDVYEAAPSVERSFELSRGEDVLTFEPIGNRLLGTGDIELRASAASGLSPSYSLVDGPALVSLGKLMLTGSEGKVTVRAKTLGSPFYLGTEVEQSFEVKQKGWIALGLIEGGSVELSPDQDLYDPGTVVTLTPKAGTGYEFESWSGELDGSSSPTTVTVNAPMSVGAKFKDVAAPTVSLTGLSAGTTSTGAFSLTGSVSDNGQVSGASWSLNGKQQGKLSLNAAGAFDVQDLSLVYGANVIEVSASDETGNVGSKSVEVKWSPERTLKIGTVLDRQEGQRLEVPIELDSKGQVSSMNFVLKYDPVYLAEPELVWSSEMVGVINSVNTNVTGELKCAFTLGGSKSVSSGARLVAKVVFRVRSIPEELNSQLGLEVLDMGDLNGDFFAKSTTAVGGVAKLQLRRVKGDNNGNDKLDSGDGTVMLRMLTDLEEVRAWDVGANDLNANSRLDSGDVTRVLKTAVRLVVKNAPKGQSPRIMSHPKSRVMRNGQTYVFRVQATGTQPLSYQWYQNGKPLAGQRSAVLVKRGLSASDSGAYWAEVSNSVGKVKSGKARLSVLGGSVGGRGVAKMSGGEEAKEAEGAVLKLLSKSGGKVKVGVDLKGLKSKVSGTTLELKYPKDVLKLVGEGSHRAGELVPEKLKNTVYWNVMPDNDYATQDGRLVFGLSSAESWADKDGEIAELEFEVLDAAKLTKAELKLVDVELTTNGYGARALKGSRMSLESGDVEALGVDYGVEDAQLLYKVGSNGSSDYVFTGQGLDGSKDPNFELVEGLTYVFELQQGGHPFVIGTEAGFESEFKGLEVEGNGLDGSGARVVIMPNADTPRKLSYYCEYHPGMLGTIRVVKADAGEVDENVSLPQDEEEETTEPVNEGDGGGDKPVDVVDKEEDKEEENNTGGSSDKDSFGEVKVYANNSASVMGNVSINGEASGDGDIVAIYVGDELRGKQEVSVNAGVAWLPNALVNSAGGNETITFKVYDASSGKTYEKSGSTAVISPGAKVGSYSEPLLIEMKSTVTQKLTLKAGWNLVSFYVEATDMAPATVLDPIKDQLEQIKNLSKSYDPSLPFFLNTLSSLSVNEGYWLKVSETVDLEVEGMVPSGATITVKTGWNLVGYPRESGAAPADELKSLGNTVEQIKNLSKSYDPALPFFLNTLGTMMPGEGYWLKVSENGTWTLGDSTDSGQGRGITKMGPDKWGTVVVYPNLTATVLAEVTLNSKAVSDGSMVAAFVGKELRSKREVVLAGGKSYVTLNVNLEETEDVSFRIWEEDQQKEHSVTNTMTLEIGETYGSAEELVKLDGTAAGKGLSISAFSHTPFSFEFNSKLGQQYVIEVSSDLNDWSKLKTVDGTGATVRVTDWREAIFNKQYYRIKVSN